MSNDKLAQAAKQALETLEIYVQTYNDYWERGMDILEPEGDAALACLREAIAEHEAEKQAGPVAVVSDETANNAAGLADMLAGIADEHSLELTDAARWALDKAAGMLRAYPPSESDKEDAELTDDEILACRRFAGAGPDTRLDRIAFAREVLRAARAKKEQP